MQRHRSHRNCTVQFWVWVILSFALLPQVALATPSVGTPLVSVSSIPVGQSATIVVSSQITTAAGDPEPIPASVNLLRVDAAGKSIVLGAMHDDGQDGDAASGDHIFSLRVAVTEPSAGTLRLQVSAAFKGKLKRTLSAAKEIPIVGSVVTNVEFSVSADKTEYAQGEGPILTLTLKNVGSESINVFPFDFTVRIDSIYSVIGGNRVTRIAPHTLPTDHCFALRYSNPSLESPQTALRLLNPGQSTSFPFTGLALERGASRDFEALEDENIPFLTDSSNMPLELIIHIDDPDSNGACFVTRYFMPIPGEYEVRFIYRYIYIDANGNTSGEFRPLASNPLMLHLK